jgi:ubiquinone/menaquinone biosynthesis C-methylase UbiE
MVDWDRGAYEDTASELLPAAERVVQRAGIEEGQAVLDLGTGTGNAALLAAKAGAKITAVDPSPRLLNVAEARIRRGRFEVAKAEDLPFGDESFDRVLSLFAVIFSEQPERAAEEILRVLRPQGRALVTAWEPVGPMAGALGVLGAAAAKASGAPQRERFGWGDPARVEALFDRASVATERVQITFPAVTAEDYLQRFESRHPAGLLFKETLTRAGNYGEIREQAKAALGDGNSITSSYFIYTISGPRTAA